MHILIYFPVRLPVTRYGGIERVIWGLGKALVRMGHRVTYLAGAGSTCDFAACLAYDPTRPDRSRNRYRPMQTWCTSTPCRRERS